MLTCELQRTFPCEVDLEILLTSAAVLRFPILDDSQFANGGQSADITDNP